MSEDSIPPELQQAIDQVNRVLQENGTKALCAAISADDGSDHGVLLYIVGMPVDMASHLQEGLNRLVQELTGCLPASDQVFGKGGLPSTAIDNAMDNFARALVREVEQGKPAGHLVSLQIPHNPHLRVIILGALTTQAKAQDGFYAELEAVMRKWGGREVASGASSG